ncbi:MAG: hypothetical protein E7062_10695 [Spirochaetaceae bacterium]|nr:hypothetical protein [Spirochaetaceae bacterium]
MYLLTTATTTSNSLGCKDILEIIYYISQIVGTIILAWTAWYAKKQYESQKTHARIEKAAELSKHFKDNLIPSMGKVQYLNNIKGLKPILEKIDLDKISVFDSDELKCFISDEDIKVFKAALLLEISTIPLDEFKEDHMRFRQLLGRCLNDLEYFCINFNSNIADTETVYQSLHQVFFDVMPIAYIFISTLNTSSANKYYTNIIAIFKEWRKLYNSQLEKERNFKKNYSKSCDEVTLISPTKLK